MVRRNGKFVFWSLILTLTVFVCCKAFAQETATEVFQLSQNEGYDFVTKDDKQDWMAFWLCRELDSLRELITANSEARREDDKELRAQLWKLALIVGGGSAIGGVGGAAAIKRKKNGGSK